MSAARARRAGAAAKTTRSPEETRALAAALAAELPPGAMLVLVGDYGSGKTTFVQGLAAGLGVPDLRAVCSPTYVMMNVYRGGRLPLFHMDATRFADPREVFGLGWEDEVEAGVTAIEWGEKVQGVLGGGFWRVEFEVKGEQERRVRIRPGGGSAGGAPPKRAAGRRKTK